MDERTNEERWLSYTDRLARLETKMNIVGGIASIGTTGVILIVIDLIVRKSI